MEKRMAAAIRDLGSSEFAASETDKTKEEMETYQKSDKRLRKTASGTIMKREANSKEKVMFCDAHLHSIDGNLMQFIIHLECSSPLVLLPHWLRLLSVPSLRSRLPLLLPLWPSLLLLPLLGLLFCGPACCDVGTCSTTCWDSCSCGPTSSDHVTQVISSLLLTLQAVGETLPKDHPACGGTSHRHRRWPAGVLYHPAGRRGHHRGERVHSPPAGLGCLTHKAAFPALG
ncbi:hypothetical protein MTO96_026850 [Rhipicephalus appendiculatus]